MFVINIIESIDMERREEDQKIVQTVRLILNQVTLLIVDLEVQEVIADLTAEAEVKAQEVAVAVQVVIEVAAQVVLETKLEEIEIYSLIVFKKLICFTL